MTSLAKQIRPWLVSSLLALFGIAEFPLTTLHGDDSQGIQQIEAINLEWEQAMMKAVHARRNAKSAIELERVQKDLSAIEHRSIEHCVDLARGRPGSIAGLIALKLVACRSQKTEEGKKAAEALVKQAESADLSVLAKALPFPVNVSTKPVHLVVPIILDRVKKNPDHPLAAKLLATVVCGLAVEDFEGMKAPAEFAEAADLISERYADKPRLQNFCEALGSPGSSPVWAKPFEKHLRILLQKNQHREVRAAASFALASVVATAGESRQLEAEMLYEEAIKNFDGREDYFYVDI